MEKQNRWAFFFMSLPAALLFGLFYCIPVVCGFAYSTLDWNGISRVKNFIGFDNFIALFSDKKIARASTFTVEYTLVMLVLILVISMALALLLTQIVKGRGFFRTMYFLPAIFSSITIALIWKQLFSLALPQIGKALGSAVFSKNILTNVKLAFWAVIFTSLWQGLSTNILLFLSALMNVPNDLIESAWLDGANGWQTFWHIKLPFLIPTLNIVTILTIKGGLMAFDHIKALTGGGPARLTESVGLLIYNYAFSDMKFSYSNALAIAVFVVVLVITVVLQRVSDPYEVKQNE